MEEWLRSIDPRLVKESTESSIREKRLHHEYLQLNRRMASQLLQSYPLNNSANENEGSADMHRTSRRLRGESPVFAAGITDERNLRSAVNEENEKKVDVDDNNDGDEGKEPENFQSAQNDYNAAGDEYDMDIVKGGQAVEENESPSFNSQEASSPRDENQNQANSTDITLTDLGEEANRKSPEIGIDRPPPLALSKIPVFAVKEISMCIAEIAEKTCNKTIDELEAIRTDCMRIIFDWRYLVQRFASRSIEGQTEMDFDEEQLNLVSLLRKLLY